MLFLSLVKKGILFKFYWLKISSYRFWLFQFKMSSFDVFLELKLIRFFSEPIKIYDELFQQIKNANRAIICIPKTLRFFLLHQMSHHPARSLASTLMEAIENLMGAKRNNKQSNWVNLKTIHDFSRQNTWLSCPLFIDIIYFLTKISEKNVLHTKSIFINCYPVIVWKFFKEKDSFSQILPPTIDV